jgi:hypothetical protein
MPKLSLVEITTNQRLLPLNQPLFTTIQNIAQWKRELDPVITIYVYEEIKWIETLKKAMKLQNIPIFYFSQDRYATVGSYKSK